MAMGFIAVPARALFVVFVLFTSIYCLLTFIPFTSIHFLQFTHFTWLSLFVKYHPALYWVALALVSVTLVEDARSGRCRLLARMFLALAGIGGVAIVIKPLLPNLRNDSRS
jgi:hypothetical protein